jgi:threonine dehydrogenase-like Zn-dependent dehydrogenase
MENAVTQGLAAVLHEFGQPMGIGEYPVPDAEPNALVVAMDTATLCGSDVHHWEGAYQGVVPLELPLILGHEGVGRVVAIGDGAEVDSVGTPVAEGDRVIWTHEPCGHCVMCTVEKQPTLCPSRRMGMFTNCDNPPHFAGMFGQYGYVWPGAGRIRVPDEVKSTWASAGSCALRTVINAVEAVGRIDFLDTVVIQGAGPVGLFNAAVVATHSAKQIIVIGAPDSRLEVARDWGATHTISIEKYPEPAERIELVRELTGGRGASVAFEDSGAPGAVPEGVEMLAANGRYMLVGALGGPPQSVPISRITSRGLTLRGWFGGHTDSYYKAMLFLRDHRDRFDWDKLFVNTYGLDEIDKAIHAMKHEGEMKPVIAPTLGAERKVVAQ